MRYIDLRSDTVTQPGAEMRRAMQQAVVGEDLYQEDPTVNLLETRVASLLGKEAAVFVPTGTMGNLMALKAHTQPGEEVILEEQSHIYNCEMAGISAVCGLLPRPLRGDANGMLPKHEVLANIRPAHRSRTRLICLENTHNFAGGSILDQAMVAELCAEAHELGLKVHLDGARLANAAVATGRTLAELSAPADSVMFSFSKGLGAPAGACLAGSAEFVASARRIRKLLGGSIHQPGMLAAACLYGLDHLIPRLRDDHRNAVRLAAGLSRVAGLKVDTKNVVTNMVIARVGEDVSSASLYKSLLERGIRIGSLDDGRLRFVTHLDVSEQDIDLVLKVLEETLVTVLSAAAIATASRR